MGTVDYSTGPQAFANATEPFTDLTVTDAQIEGFSDAIMSFWRDVPDNIYEDSDADLPKWFESAWRKDRAASDNPSNRPRSL